LPNIIDRETRRGLQLTLNVSGRDEKGAPYAEAARTVNISGGGICFEAVRRIPVGARVDLRIQVPPSLRRHFRGRAAYVVRAVVCRSEPVEEGATYRTGCRFVGELEA
jgi:PilZ domain-containing protein